MNILLTAATEAEIAPLIKHIQANWKPVDTGIFQNASTFVRFCITGVGGVATAWHLGTMLASQTYDLALQAGICGSFNRNIGLGEVVFVRSEQMADLGAEDGEQFIDVFDLHLADANMFPYKNKQLVNPDTPAELNLSCKAVQGLSVNTVTGRDETAQWLAERHSCDVEGMEGAAFHYACLLSGTRFAQVRAVSNYVEKRNKTSWKIEAAIANLNSFLARYLEKEIL